MTPIKTKTITVPSGTTVFYREQSPLNASAPVFLLLHGFPSSSHQYRNLIPLLATRYRVVARTCRRSGSLNHRLITKYTFENLAKTVGEFLDALSITRYSIYVFDYGAPVGFRLALARPTAVEAIVTQNGNAYAEGFGGVWGPLQKLWASDNDPKEREIVTAAMLNEDITKFQYLNGTPDPSSIAPETYTLDYALLLRPGIKEHQLDLFFDYQNNVALYDKFHEYFRTSQVRLLAIWGKEDVFFIPAGAEAFRQDLPNARVQLIDAGHFAAESHTELIARDILAFLQ
ncbi:hydrolase-like protein [Coniochaeta sp. PMI_546]|nr:hydrolase-like protein [Coniochaeta sp. PMI_546]